MVWERTTLVAGLCQSLMPDLVGLGDRKQADAVHLRWPSGLEQAELNLPAGSICAIEETRRRGTSCPLLFVWNGRRFEFVTDFLGGGGIGYLVSPGNYSEPDPDEDLKIEPPPIPDQRNRLVLGRRADGRNDVSRCRVARGHRSHPGLDYVSGRTI